MATEQKPLKSGFGAKTTAREVLAGLDLTGTTAVVRIYLNPTDDSAYVNSIHIGGVMIHYQDRWAVVTEQS